MAAVLGGAAFGGAIGGGLAVTILGPLTAANNFIGSFFFGDGMIIGERLAYQNDWPKIQIRMAKGESFLKILEEYTRNNTAAVMQSARTIIEIVTPLWFDMVSQYLKSIPLEILEQLKNPAPAPQRDTAVGAAAQATAQATGIPQWAIDLGFAAFAEEQKTNTLTTSPPAEVDLKQNVPNWKSLTLSQAQKIRNKMKDLQQDRTQPKLYNNILLFIKVKINAIKTSAVKPPKIIENKFVPSKLSRGTQSVLDGLIKYFKLYKTNKTKSAQLLKIIRANRHPSQAAVRYKALRVLTNLEKERKTIMLIFNSKLRQAQTIPELKAQWGGVRRLIQ